MTSEQQKEQFSIAYVRAIAAVAGVNVYRPEVDEDSVDVGFSTRTFFGQPQRPRLEAQLKCTADPVGENASFGFALRVKNYNELVGEFLVPRLLIVVVVPPTAAEWLTQDEQSLAMRHCGYWVSLGNAPATTNTSNVTIQIPRSQVLTVAALQKHLGMGGTS